jgi:hypothetical protein
MVISSYALWTCDGSTQLANGNQVANALVLKALLLIKTHLAVIDQFEERSSTTALMSGEIINNK